MSQVPYGPEDLNVAPLSGDAFLDSLRADYARKTEHPPVFYQRLFNGELDADHLKLWAKDHYLYWDTLYFSTGAVFIKTNEPGVRSKLLQRVVEVEGREIVNDVRPEWMTPAYEELWLAFGEGLGLSRDEVSGWPTFTRTFFCVTTLCMYARGWEWTWLDGLASLYASDRFYAELFERAGPILRDRYRLSPDSLEVFEVVARDARENIAWEEPALAYWACTTERQLTAGRAFRERIDIEHQLLASVEEVVTTGSYPFQIPPGTTIPVLLERK